VEFPEFAKQEVCKLLMFQDNFESFDWTLISLRSLALALTLFPPLAGQVGTRFFLNSWSFCLFPFTFCLLPLTFPNVPQGHERPQN
jgi:hypothetical protein